MKAFEVPAVHNTVPENQKPHTDVRGNENRLVRLSDRIFPLCFGMAFLFQRLYPF
jgi:hypothetical protein